MRNDITPSTPQATPAHSASAGNCLYCGAPLHSGFYFCLVCATPYQHPDNVVPVARPLELSEGQLVRRKTPQVWTLFWTFFGVVIGAAMLSYAAFGERNFGLQLVLQSVILLGVTAVFGAMHWKSLWVQFKRIGFFMWQPYAALGGLAVMLLINYALYLWLRQILPGDDPLATLKHDVGLGPTVFLICVVPAVLEETAFRGLVQHWLQTALRPWRAILLTSVLFTTLHFNIFHAPYLFALSCMLGWTKWKTGSLYPCMLIHFLHNYVVIAFFA